MSDLIEIVNNDTLLVEEQVVSTIEVIDEEILTITEESITLISEAAQGPQGIPGTPAGVGDIAEISPDPILMFENALI